MDTFAIGRKYTLTEILSEDILPFQKILEIVKKEGLFSVFILQSSNLIENLIVQKKLTKKDVRCLLESIQFSHDLYNFSRYGKNLLRYILSQDLLTVDLVSFYDQLIRQHSLFKKRNIHNIFELFEKKHASDQEMLKCIETYKYTFCFPFNKKQRTYIRRKFDQSSSSKSVVIRIVNNNLQKTYTFDQLKALLEKDDKKMKCKLNF